MSIKVDGKAYRNLLKELTLSQFKLKDQSTFFGYLWSFLNPLLTLLVLFVFFRLRLGQDIPHYAVYMLIGIIQYTHFSNSTNAAMHVLYSMRTLTGNTIFPKELLVLGSVLSSSIEFAFSLLIAALIAFVSGVPMTWTVVLLPGVIILQVMFVVWISLLLSCLYVFVRDADHIYQVFLRVLFFMTPIFYDLSFVGKGVARYLVLLNPLTLLISLSRMVLLEGKPFSPSWFVFLLAANAALMYGGFTIFRKLEPTFAEHL